jgi:hypothetical protein
MKSHFICFTASIALAWATAATAQQSDENNRVTKMEITFATTADGKDGNTQVKDRVFLDGQDYATLECCSSGNSGDDVWNSGNTSTRPMSITKPMTKAQVRKAQIEFGMRPNGNDKWEFRPTLRVTYEYGPADQWTFDQFYLAADSVFTSRTFSISH